MMKREYIKPAMKPDGILQENIICTSVQRIESNEDIEFGGGGDGPARARDNGNFNVWSEEE